MLRRSLARLFCLSLPFMMSATAAATEEAVKVVAAVTVNSVPKGDLFLYLTPAGQPLVRPSDLAAIGIPGIVGETVDIEGETWLRLATVSGIDARFDERQMILEIVSSPALLGRTVIDIGPASHSNVLKPTDDSAFFNYRIDYTGGTAGSASLSLAGEVGIRLADWLLLSDLTHADNLTQRKTLRLSTSLSRDWRESLQRLTVGDFFATSGELGSLVNFGGISFSKRYTIDPYFIFQPMADLAGAIPLPSEVAVYLDGMQVRREKLPPGEFLIKNLNYYGGAHDIQIVVKDRFGREQTIDYGYYFSDELLKHGLHEYSYNLGSLRRDYGTVSNDYGGWAASFFHRYGMSDALTVGLHGEATAGRFNLGPKATFRIGQLGTASLQLATSMGDRGNGWAAQVGYGYKSRGLNFAARLRSYASDYSWVLPPKEQPKSEIGVSIGYGSPQLGNFGLAYSSNSQYEGTDRRRLSLSYSRSLPGNFSLYASLSRVEQQTEGSEFFLAIGWYPDKGFTAGYLHQRRPDNLSDALQVSKNAPTGEGWGWRFSVEREHGQTNETSHISPYLQYNGRYGIYSIDYRAWPEGNQGGDASYTFSAAGAVAYVGNTLGFSRPIYDSFGLVKVGEIPDVRVFQSNQEIGRTNATGELFLPNLGSYLDNHIAIADKDVPIEFTIAEKEKYVSPPLRSGSLIRFDVMRIQIVTGILKLKVNGKTQPAEFYEVSIDVKNARQTFHTGRGGEFYLENLPAGQYPATFRHNGKTCAFELSVPEIREMVVDLGEVVCAQTD